MPRPRLLIVGSFPSPSNNVAGGQITACRALREGPLAKRFRIRTVDSTQQTNPPPPVGLRAALALPRMLRVMAELLLHRPDVVLLFTTRGPSFVEKGLLSRVCGWLRIRNALFVRSFLVIEDFGASKLQRWLMLRLLTKSDLFLCQGRTLQAFAEHSLGYSRDRAPIIPNWTATPEVLEVGRRRASEPRSGCTKFLYTGWIKESKGVVQLLDAAKMLAAEGREFRLTLAGDGTHLSWAEEFVKKNGLDKRIELVGRQDADCIRQLLLEHDVFVLPSKGEGMPNSLIEAMAARLACITSPVGAIPDFLVHDHHALFVAPGDVPGLAAAMRDVSDNPQLRSRLGKSAFELAETVFSSANAMMRLGNALDHRVPRY